MGHNKPPLSKAELELAFRERTRADRIKEHTPFDLRWQWEVWLSDLPASAMLVAFAIRIYANNTGAESSPSLDTLAMMTKLSRRNVQDSLKLIERHLVRKSAGAGRSPNRYALIIPGETLQELATVIDMHSRAPRASQADRSEAPTALQDDFVAGHPLPHNAVVGQNQNRSRAPGANDITRDITTTLENVRDARSLSKAVALGIAAGAGALPAAAAPIEPPAIIQSVREISYEELKARLMEAGGEAIGISAGLEVLSVPRRWLTSGCDLIEDILPAIKARAAKMPPRSINSWNYFEQAVADAKAARASPMVAGKGRNPQGAASYDKFYDGAL